MELLKNIKGQLSHRLLLQFMPFDSGWYDDGEGRPEPYSVMIASVLTAIGHANTCIIPKVYTN